VNAEYKDDDVYEKNLLGKERTKEAAAAYMKQFESDLHAEMKKNKTKYTKKAGGVRAYDEWLFPGLGHLPAHPAHDWILAHSRYHGASIRHLPTMPSLSSKHLIFDMLHGLYSLRGGTNNTHTHTHTHTHTCTHGRAARRHNTIQYM